MMNTLYGATAENNIRNTVGIQQLGLIINAIYVCMATFIYDTLELGTLMECPVVVRHSNAALPSVPKTH